MKPAKLLEYIWNLALVFYRALLKLSSSINAHQIIAYWRTKINARQRTAQASRHNIGGSRLTQQISAGDIRQQQEQRQQETVNSVLGYPSQHLGLPIKTPNSRRLKLYSILRSLSIRNFMEYCVIALNEASSSSCSNKFDLSSCDRPVWLLGQEYALPQDADELINDIRSKLWITYRRNFPPIDESTRYTTDRGFGCMIRCGQMVLANALLQKSLGRDWRWSPNGLEANPDVYIRILKLFQDREDCPYSIHNIVRVGQQEGKVIGEWFGPNTIAQALKRMAISLSIAEATSDEVLISIDAALDNVVVIDEIKTRFKHIRGCNFKETINEKRNQAILQQGDKDFTDSKIDSNCWTPGILFIQLRLGLTKINPLYFAALKKTFQFKNSLGIIGGRPNHALYLIGYTDDDIIYLDPHSTQQYIDLDNDNLEDSRFEDVKSLPLDSTYHCASPEKMPIDRLDPSLALCFYFHTEQEFNEWCSISNDLLVKSEQAPMFEMTEHRPSGWNVSLTSTAIKSLDCSDRKEQKFTILKKNDYETADGMELKTVDLSKDCSATLNDDEEFEMLG